MAAKGERVVLPAAIVPDLRVTMDTSHLHDLRHTGGTRAATTGASLKELMSRMGHASTRAALIYQHASEDRDKVIVEALGDAFKTARKGTKRRSGTQRARKRKKAS